MWKRCGKCGKQENFPHIKHFLKMNLWNFLKDKLKKIKYLFNFPQILHGKL